MWKVESKKVEPVVLATAVTYSFLSLSDIKNGEIELIKLFFRAAMERKQLWQISSSKLHIF